MTAAQEVAIQARRPIIMISHFSLFSNLLVGRRSVPESRIEPARRTALDTDLGGRAFIVLQLLNSKRVARDVIAMLLFG